MDLRKCRNNLRLLNSFIFMWLYIPHLIIYQFSEGKNSINLDCIKNGADQQGLRRKFSLLYSLHNDKYFRSLFYFRIGPIWSLLIKWLRPGEKSFIFSATTKIGNGVRIEHPYSTIINAERIGNNFACRQLTTIGNKSDDDLRRPIIGDNVTLGANVTIIGPVSIGNNVIVGAGSVVVKNVPDNVVIAGNPARIIKYNLVNE